jgi:hypothetical protein
MWQMNADLKDSVKSCYAKKKPLEAAKNTNQ